MKPAAESGWANVWYVSC